MMDLSPLRPNDWLAQDLAWWADLVEARTIWDDAHRSATAARTARAAAGGP